jgi:predicted RNA binding protein YcfA (HicA-like mRNA interferase family)
MSEFDYSALRSLTARKLIKALETDGFVLNRQSGSHRHYRHSDGRRVTVTFHHSGETFLLKTLKSMIEIQACWNESDLHRLHLIS